MGCLPGYLRQVRTELKSTVFAPFVITKSVSQEKVVPCHLSSPLEQRKSRLAYFAGSLLKCSGQVHHREHHPGSLHSAKMTTEHDSGGFLQPPTPSSVASTNATPPLPHPRASPLRSGGAKESAFIRFVENQMSHIQRRFAKRTSPSGNGLSDVDRDKADVWGDVKGYSKMKEVCKDIEELVDVVWGEYGKNVYHAKKKKKKAN
jgi:hypothetical protein